MVKSSGAERMAVLEAQNGKSGGGIESRFAVVKIFVEIKNEVFRQRQRPSSGPSGLLLRSAATGRNAGESGRMFEAIEQNRMKPNR